MSSNEQFPTSQPVQPERVDPVQPHAAPEQADPVRAAQPEASIGAANAAPARLPTMADLDSLADSLDQVDQTLAQLDQPQAAS